MLWPSIRLSVRHKSMFYQNFRGIAISPIISKVFEYCVIDRYKEFFVTADNQFGFRKGLSCSHAVYSTRCIVDSVIKNGNTANLCSIDLSSHLVMPVLNGTRFGQILLR